MSADDQWAVIADGGQEETGGNILLWKQPVFLRVTHRHKRTRAVYDADDVLKTALALFQPTESPSVLSKTLIPITDTDEDAEGRHTASWRVQLTIITK